VSMGRERQNEESGKMVKGVFCDAYLFYLKYHGKPMGPELWESAVKDMGETIRKYHGGNLCGRLMLAAFSQLEEETR